MTRARRVSIGRIEMIRDHQRRRVVVMQWWRDVLGPTRTRQSVTPAEIQAQLDAQVLAGRSVRTLNLLRATLIDFYVVMNGPDGPNPARAVPRYGVSKTSQIH